MDPAGFAVGGALASVALWSLQLRSVFPHGQQMWVEWMAWAVIVGACKLRLLYLSRAATATTTATTTTSHPLAPIDEEKSMPSPKASLRNTNITLVTFLLVMSQFITLFAGEAVVRWAYPIVTLFVFLANNLSRPQGRICDYGVSSAVMMATCIVSAICLIFSGPKFNYHVFGFGISYAALTAAGYYCLVDMSHEDSNHDMDRPFFSRLLDALDAIGVRAFGMCTLFLALTSTPIPRLGVFALVFVMLRLAQLFAIVTLCSANFPFVAAAMATVASVVSDDVLTITPLAGVVDILVAAAALVQAYSSLPKIRSSRALLFALLLVPLIRVILPSTTNVESGSLRPTQASSIGPVHPIEQLVKMKQQDFQNMLASQSQTVEEAVTEYKRRYGRPPPPDFGKWFEVAKSKDFLFIDELDTIMESLEPFWGVPPASLRARIKSVQKAEQITSVTVGYDSVSQSGDHYHVEYMKYWLNRSTWGDTIPQVNFVISMLDEPRVVVPDDTLDLAMLKVHEHKKDGNSQSWWNTETSSGRDGKSSARSNDVQWISVGKQHAWEAMVSSCHIDDPARRETNVEQKKTLLPFVSNVTAEKDVCASSDLLHSHGFLASPESLIVTHSLVPIFSQCKPSIFNDVLYPSPYYQMQITSGDYNEAEDPSWEDKLDRMYWAGVSTGGFSTSQNWMNLHRQRLTMMTAPQNTERVHLLERDVKGDWQPRSSTWSTISSLFYTRLTAVVQCSEEACAAQHEVFNAPMEDKSAALTSKYLMDIDGNSFSGRYYRLLKSKSAVLKYTVFKEWHDDRLIPWVHYIPISNSAEELGETMRFLVDEPEGRKIGERIAQESRDWTQKTFREEDLEIVFMRVLMEYARIMDDKRDTMNFEIHR